MKTIKSKHLYALLVLSAVMASCLKTGPDRGAAGERIIPRLTSSVLTKAGTAVPEQDTLFKYSDEDISVTLFEEDNLTGIGEVPTKGAVVTTSGLNADGKQFRMDAWLGSANRYDGTQDGDGLVYDTADKDNYHFISETVTYGSGSWSMGAEHIWRNSVPTSFWSLHPVSATGWTVTLPGDKAEDDDQKKLSFTYTIPTLTDGAGAAGQPDLCVAFSHWTWEDGSDNFVDIDFKHALSAVYFDITDIPEGLSVTKIAIKGLKGSGSCTVTGSTSGTSSAKGVTFGWTTSGGNRSWSQSFGDSDFETSGGRRVTKESGSKIFMLIPQTLTADTKLSVTFYDGTNSTTREASIGDGTTSFKAGKRYTFRLGVKDGVLTAGLPDPYNGDPLDGTDLGDDGLDPYSGDPLEDDEIEVSGITLDPTSKTIDVGESFTITATVSPSDATDKTVTWTSSDPTVATVDSDGKVTGVKAGTATITASAGGKTATCTVTVKNPTATVSLVANPSGSASFKIDGSAATSKEVTSGTTVTIKAKPASGDYVFVKWSDGGTDPERTVTVNEDVEYTAVFSYKITAYIPVGYVYGNASSAVEYLDVNKATFTAGNAPSETSFVGWIKEGGDGTVLSTDATYTTDPSSITAATNFIPVFKSVATSKYVDIITVLNYDKTVKIHTKWAKQNLSISTSGSKSWKGGNSSAVKVPGTDEDVKVGDYFQWAAYAGYCGSKTSSDKGLLVYKSFTNKDCGDSSDDFTFKSGKSFKLTYAPYSNSIVSTYDNTYSKTTKTTLVETDDVAHIILGGNWRMPTSAEFQTLYDATKWTWNDIDHGYYVTKKGETLSSDKSNALLFFPAAGSGLDGGFDDDGSDGYYWSSSLSSDITGDAYGLGFNSSIVRPRGSYYRYRGGSVRPVSD